jgi:hypothetical protein
MREQDVDTEFSWPLALLITGISFLAFFYILQKLNDASPRLFLWAGIISLAAAFVFALGSMFVKQSAETPYEQRDK